MIWNDTVKNYIPLNWKVTTLKDQYKLERGISYTSSEIEKGVGIPMINLASVDTHRNYKPNDLKYFNGVISDKNILNSNDLLIACTDMTRNADIVGCPILVPNDNNKYTYTMDMAKITPINTEINKYYLYMTLRTDFYHKYIKKWASGTNVLHLNLSGLDWYTIWIPPQNLQIEFANLVKSIHAQKSKIYIENNVLSSLRNYLLPLLMNGQITIE